MLISALSRISNLKCKYTFVKPSQNGFSGGFKILYDVRTIPNIHRIEEQFSDSGSYFEIQEMTITPLEPESFKIISNPI